MKKKPETKINFAPIPARAMGDETLTALDLRVLIVVAAHDRFGGNGIGCYAGHKRLAALAQCHLKSLSRSLAALAQAGYITGRENPLNRKTRIYQVVYSEQDTLYMKSCEAPKGNKIATDVTEIGNEPATDHDMIGNELATQTAFTGNQTAPKTSRIGNHSNSKTVSNHEDAEGNISCEAVINHREADERYPAEAARPSERDISDGETLSKIERIMRTKKLIPQDNITLNDLLAEINERAEPSSQEWGRSNRLMEELNHLMHDDDQA
ncbi:helix-turn-helix domain-containing protein [Rhizobium sp. Leaf453]|uniref:helix-turn-helix domain-containing protein n=1 Tax=Rhizobium sp. Leaf453 TaxID=1736380 RepID=UPI0007150232|nr:helix-turn-helix domain-containing protein [Rhizobium sp. Leaf453]KQT96968.1 hypothetical protein ASG68_08400 [Rhizobium sp. Leaf453]